MLWRLPTSFCEFFLDFDHNHRQHWYFKNYKISITASNWLLIIKLVMPLLSITSSSHKFFYFFLFLKENCKAFSIQIYIDTVPSTIQLLLNWRSIIKKVKRGGGWRRNSELFERWVWVVVERNAWSTTTTSGISFNVIKTNTGYMFYYDKFVSFSMVRLLMSVFRF